MNKKKHISIKIVLIIVVMALLGGVLYYVCSKDSFSKKTVTSKDIYMDIINNVNINENALISEYTIYGRYFNIKGNINSISISNSISNVEIVLKTNDNEYKYSTIYKLENNSLSFKTSEYINKGILLDNIEIGNYLVLLKVSNNEEFSYYNLDNNNKYDKLEYYTTTKNNSNNKIIINNNIDSGYKYMTLECNKEKLPNNIYDIVIDAGHGGIDSGAVNGQYKESTFTLSYSKSLKESLEELGYKVKLTRDGDYKLKEYGIGSRTGISYETKAKLLLSIHLNSSKYNVGSGGVEIYAASDDDINFAQNIADNIVDITSSNYSPNNVSKVSNGVYKRIFTNETIKSGTASAQKEGWEYYNIDNNTTYYYIIRETGGIITKAYVDGRNKDYDANPYYQSNHGTESYLLELGYISSSKNIKSIINEKDNYIKAITKSVNEYLNNDIV